MVSRSPGFHLGPGSSSANTCAARHMSVWPGLAVAWRVARSRVMDLLQPRTCTAAHTARTASACPTSRASSAALKGGLASLTHG